MKLLLILIVLAGIGYGAYALITSDEAEKTSEVILGTEALDQKNEAEKQLAVSAAKDLYRIKKLEGMDFSSGPCLSEKVIAGWVVDIAHNPRTAVDDFPENQCLAYRNGTAEHFVELDPEGELIRAE